MNPGRTGLIGAPTYPMLRDATQAALLEILERNQIPHELNRAENYLVLRETQVADPVPGGGGVRKAAREQPGLVRAGRTDVHAGRSVAAARRAAAGSEGDEAVRVRGVDAQGIRLGVRAVHRESGGGYETVIARPFENRFLLDRFRTITSG